MQRCWNADDRYVEPSQIGRVTRNRVAVRKRLGKLGVGHIADMTTYRSQRSDSLLIDVEPESREPDLHRPHRDRQAHIALADQHHPGRPIGHTTDRSFTSSGVMNHGNTLPG